MVSNTDLAFLALTLVVLNKRKKEKTTVVQGVEPEDYRNFLRMDGESFDYLLELVRPDIEKKDTNMREAIPASQRLSITLRYLASGADLEDLKFTCAIAPQTLESIIMETCSAITKALKKNIQVPKSQDGWERVSQEFEEQWNFPNCLGSADGKHVAIQKPPNSGSYYYNYKGYFSIVLMAVVDANYKFLMVDVGANGRVSDGGVMKNTLFWRKLSENQLNLPDPRQLPGTSKKCPYVFLGDEAFQLHPNFMKPYNRAALTNDKTIYNYRLSRARRVVENAFGILTKRFKIFQKPIKFEPLKVRKIVMTYCHLHNYLCSKNRANYLPPQDIDNEDVTTGAKELGSWRQDTPQMLSLQKTKGNATVLAKTIRDDFCEFFNTSGAVAWQNKYLIINK
ncbi:uncharacterized protein LOC116164601 [Photinus pyralis]|nr:uncharacterized protein LOC116164601 [Photinus pyralis]